MHPSIFACLMLFSLNCSRLTALVGALSPHREAATSSLAELQLPLSPVRHCRWSSGDCQLLPISLALSDPALRLLFPPLARSGRDSIPVSTARQARRGSSNKAFAHFSLFSL
ncbi:hypothetical protein BDV06DRAFT_190487, partial [Aspergillus oleicola]